jgi:hypothetical protein
MVRQLHLGELLFVEVVMTPIYDGGRCQQAPKERPQIDTEKQVNEPQMNTDISEGASLREVDRKHGERRLAESQVRSWVRLKCALRDFARG